MTGVSGYGVSLWVSPLAMPGVSGYSVWGGWLLGLVLLDSVYARADTYKDFRSTTVYTTYCLYL